MIINWKHTAAALCAVVTVVSMATVQYSSSMSAMADEQRMTDTEIDVLEGDGEGEAPAFDEYIQESLVAEVPVETPYEVKTGHISYAGGSVNVRGAASKEADIVGSLSLGDAVQVTNDTDDGLWYAVTLEDGTNGYIMCDLISFDYEAIKAQMLATTMYLAGTVSVSGGNLNVRHKPSEQGIVIDQIGDGAVVYISETADGGWYKVLFGRDYDTGYVMSQYVTVGEMVKRAEIDKARKDRLNSVAKKGTVVTDGNYVNVRNAPSENADVVTTVKNGIKCTVISRGSKWTKILTSNNEIAYIITSAILDDAALADYNAKKAEAEARAAEAKKQEESKKKEEAKTQAATKKQTPAAQQEETKKASSKPADASMGAKIIAEAEKYIGVKYVYGGNSPSGFDCSGFVQYTMKKVGINVNRTSRDQYKNGVAVARSDLQAGDLVFFSKGGSITHVGIYAGNDKVIHSPSAGYTVRYTTLSHMCSYSTYVGARRVY